MADRASKKEHERGRMEFVGPRHGPHMPDREWIRMAFNTRKKRIAFAHGLGHSNPFTACEWVPWNITAEDLHRGEVLVSRTVRDLVAGPGWLSRTGASTS